MRKPCILIRPSAMCIGTGAGKKLMEEIKNAKQSVKIVSVYLSPYVVKKLIDLHYRGVEVKLIYGCHRGFL